MRYIRTKEEMDKIHEVAWTNCGYIGFLDTKNGCDISHIYKQSDTLEELCDEFVFINEIEGLPNKTHVIYFDSINHLITEPTIKEKIDFIKKIYRDEEDITRIRGAIWTDKGLIYVAKMKGILSNGEIDWELL